jgi:ribA/ribD-fused uncharacterized protein
MSAPRTIEYFEGRFFFLSNFFPILLEYDGAVYPTNEHAFQAAKTIDPLERIVFQDPKSSPSDVKKLGRAITLRHDWEQVKNSIMKEQLLEKFSDRHPIYLKGLLNTEDRTLVEGNLWHDNIWGNCHCMDNLTVRVPFGSKAFCVSPGQNRLGLALMEVRAERLACQS